MVPRKSEGNFPYIQGGGGHPEALRVFKAFLRVPTFLYSFIYTFKTLLHELYTNPTSCYEPISFASNSLRSYMHLCRFSHTFEAFLPFWLLPFFSFAPIFTWSKSENASNMWKNLRTCMLHRLCFSLHLDLTRESKFNQLKRTVYYKAL